MGIIKDRNGMDLTEAEDIKKRWQEYTQELYKKDLHDPDNHNGVITHPEPDILECTATPKSPPTRRVPPRGTPRVPAPLPLSPFSSHPQSFPASVHSQNRGTESLILSV